MKRLIAVLLVMGVIMTTFAETASTTVSLNLSENYATVWFSEETAGTVSIDNYELSLKNPEGLIQSIAGNSSSEKIYACILIGTLYLQQMLKLL